MKKRIISVMLCILMLMSMSVVSFAASSSYAVDFDIDAPSTVSAGETFTVTVGVDGMEDHVLSGTIQLCYDTSMLEYVSVTAIGDDVDNFAESSAYCNTVNDEMPGKVVVGFFSIDDCPEDFVRIMTVTFKAKKNGNTEIEVLNFNDWSDEYNGRKLWFSDIDGFPTFVNNSKIISISDYSSDYRVNYVIDQPAIVEQGKEFTVSVAVDKMKGHVLTCSLEFTYDTSMLELKSCECPGDSTDGSFYQDEVNDYIYVLNKETAGKVIVAFMPVDVCNSDVVDIVEFTFVAKKTGDADIEISGTEWNDSYNGQRLWTYEGEGNMPQGMEETIYIVAEEPAPVEAVLGDVNGDAKITAADARIVLRYSAKLETLSAAAEKNADVNKDGKVNAADARMILRVSAKIDDFENPVTPTPPPATTPTLSLKSNMSSCYLDKGGTAIIDIEVCGDLNGKSLKVSYDSNSFRCEWEENWYKYSNGNNVAVLYVSALKYTSAKTVRVYVDGYKDSIYVDIAITAASDGWWDYGGYPGVVDYGAYTRVAPYFYWMSEDALAVGFYYDINALFGAGHSSDVLLTDFFDYLEYYGYTLIDYSSDSTSSDYTFYNSKLGLGYVYSIMFDKYGDVSDIRILFVFEE